MFRFARLFALALAVAPFVRLGLAIACGDGGAE